jgi:alpha-D-ribose 1-methylphosphonate 5-triphosphate synthase subunit PhnG
MSVLAQATPSDLEDAWNGLGDKPEYERVRGPEVGLVMLRGRAGGMGARFNLGEMTVTRCTVTLSGRPTGHAYVGGRNLRHAELAAVFDALLQDPERRELLEASVVGPLESRERERRRLSAARSAPTRVEFFTLVRGED